MTDGSVAAAAVVAAGAGGAVLGIDTDALIWGLGGGLAMLSVQQPMGKARAVWVVATAAIVAAAFSAPVVAFVIQPMLPPGRAGVVDPAVSFGLGLLSQKLIGALLDHGPSLFGRLFRRVTGDGDRQ